jgi:hypothetical protein
MELKTARLTLLIDPNKKAAFERLCAQHDLTASQVVRQMIRDYLVHYGVSYTPSGQEPAEPCCQAALAAWPQGCARKTAKARDPPLNVTGLSTISTWLPIDWMLGMAALWLGVGLAGVLALHRLAFVARVLFPLGGWPGW